MSDTKNKEGTLTRILDFGFLTELTVESVEYFTDSQVRCHTGRLGQIKNLKSNTDVS